MVELEPNRRIAIKLSGGGFTGTHTISLHPAGDDTSVTSALEYGVSRALKIFCPMLNLVTKRYVKKCLSWFEEACEAEPAA